MKEELQSFSKGLVTVIAGLTILFGTGNYLKNHNKITLNEEEKTITYSKIDSPIKNTKIQINNDGSKEILYDGIFTFSTSIKGIDYEGDSNLDSIIIREKNIFRDPKTSTFSKNDGKQVSKDTISYFNKNYKKQLERFEQLIDSY